LLALAVGVFLAGTCAASQPPSTNGANLRPVIGVFSQQTSTITGSSTIDPEVKAVRTQSLAFNCHDHGLLVSEY
jgi:hypothetical protein